MSKNPTCVKCLIPQHNQGKILLMFIWCMGVYRPVYCSGFFLLRIKVVVALLSTVLLKVHFDGTVAC